MRKKLIVIGGGASGIFCAIQAAYHNEDLDVLVVEKQSQVLQKVKVSGGGRCNVTHACFKLSELIKRYPRGGAFLKKTFSQFAPTDTIAWFKEHGVELKTESDGRMFPITNSSQTIIDTLLKACSAHKIEIRVNTDIQRIQSQGHAFVIHSRNGEVLQADYLFLACGGYPKKEQYHWITDMGHTIAHPIPSLFTFKIPDPKLCALMGLSVSQAIVRIVGSGLEYSGSLLITHWGLSGPAVLKLSAYGALYLAENNYQVDIQINWLGEKENSIRSRWAQLREQCRGLSLKQKNPFAMPNRLWEYLISVAGIDIATKWSELPSKEQNKLIHTLTTHTMKVNGKTTFKEEFVTCGGIHTHEIDPHTMQSNILQGIYIGGELMNVDGITGGYNFQHAWTTGYIAGKAIAKQAEIN